MVVFYLLISLSILKKKYSVKDIIEGKVTIILERNFKFLNWNHAAYTFLYFPHTRYLLILSDYIYVYVCNVCKIHNLLFGFLTCSFMKFNSSNELVNTFKCNLEDYILIRIRETHILFDITVSWNVPHNLCILM